jgi:hypothetical protein
LENKLDVIIRGQDGGRRVVVREGGREGRREGERGGHGGVDGEAAVFLLLI